VQTDIVFPNNKPDITTHDHQKGTCVSIHVAISGGRNVIKKEAKKIISTKTLTTEIHHMWDVTNNSDTNNNRGKWNHLKII